MLRFVVTLSIALSSLGGCVHATTTPAAGAAAAPAAGAEDVVATHPAPDDRLASAAERDMRHASVLGRGRPDGIVIDGRDPRMDGRYGTLLQVTPPTEGLPRGR